MARLSLDIIDSIRSDEYDAALIRFVAKNWEQVSERVAKRTISWLRNNAADDMAPALQVTFLELDDKALRYIPDLSRVAQRFVLESLEESDVAAMIGKAHAYTVIVPELWDAVIANLEAGTLNKRDLANYEGRDRLPRAFKQALATHNVASVTKLSDAIRTAARSRRAAKVDYVKSFEEASTVVQIRNAAQLLLKACKDGEVESTSSARRALREVINADSARDVKQAQKAAWLKFAPAEPEAKPARTSSRRAAEPVKEEVTSDLLTAFMSATRSAHMQEHAQALLKGARRAGIKLTAAQRRLIQEVVNAESSYWIRAYHREAMGEFDEKPATNRFKDVDVEPRRRPKVVATSTASDSDNDIPDVDLLAAWLNARRTADMKATSQALLKGARRQSIKLNKETRECLKDIEVCESRSDIRAAYHDAVNAHQNGTAEQRVVSRPKNAATEAAEKREARARNKAAEDTNAYGRLARTLITGTDGNVKPESDGSEYEIPDDDEADQDRSSRRRRSSPAATKHEHHAKRRGAASAEDTSTRRRATSDTERVSRRRVGADRSRDTDFSDAARVAASVRRVRRPQDHI